MPSTDARRCARTHPESIGRESLAGLVGPILSGTREEAISVVDVDKLQWKDYPGLPRVTSRSFPATRASRIGTRKTRYVTVIKGTWWTGAGPKFDPETTVPVKVGGFAILTPKEIHYDEAKDGEVIVQVSGIGPTGTTPINPDGTDEK